MRIHAKLKGRNSFGDLPADKSIILKWMFEKGIEKLGLEFNRLKIGSSSRLL
jgi:hypothetical protein